MLSFRRLAVTATAVAALAVPAAAQARPDASPASQPTVDKVSPDARYGVPEATPATIDKVSPDARYGVPDETTPTIVSVPRTEIVEADDGFAWGDALLGGGAALALTLLVGGTAATVRLRHSAAAH